MEKPHWRVRSSEYVIDSKFLRLRKDAIELPDGTLIEDYYVRESDGFVVIFPLTRDGHVLVTHQYRYGADTIGSELPAGMLERAEDPLLCAQRELLEETGYEADRWEAIGLYYAEPVRSNAKAHLFIAHGCHKTAEQSLDPTEHIVTEEVDLDRFHEMLRDGRIESLGHIAAAYAALDHLDSD